MNTWYLIRGVEFADFYTADFDVGLITRNHCERRFVGTTYERKMHRNPAMSFGHVAQRRGPGRRGRMKPVVEKNNLAPFPTALLPHRFPFQSSNSLSS